MPHDDIIWTASMTLRDPPHESNVNLDDAGLLSPTDLMPLTQTLIPPDLASVFKISSGPPISATDVRIATERTLANLQQLRKFETPSYLDCDGNTVLHQPISIDQRNCILPTTCGFPLLPASSIGKDLSLLPIGAPTRGLKLEADLWNPGSEADQQRPTQSAGYDDVMALSGCTPFLSLDKRPENGYGISMSGAAESSEGVSGKKLKKRIDIELEDADSGGGLENSNEEATARTLKRPRLVWTPQLHKRFVDAVAHLGIKSAVPKTIMQMMNVEGLTRENVASHLQKYRLYLRRTQGLSTEGPSVSDQLFASTPVPPNLAASTHFLSGHGEDMIPLIMPMPMVGISPNHHISRSLGVAVPYRSFDHNMYNGFTRLSPSQQMFPSSNQEFLLDNQARPVSPHKRVLTLFPTGGI